MIKWFSTIFFFLSLTFSFAQIDVGVEADIPFDDCTADDGRGDPSIVGVINGQPTCECGVVGKALRLDGVGDHIFIAGPVNGEFDTQDFSVSFYFKPLSNTGTQTILKKAATDCPSQSHFAVRYEPNSRRLNIEFVENSNKIASISGYPLPPGNCWQHIVLIRRNTKTILYVNGQLAAEVGAISRVNLTNTGILTIGEPVCSATDRYFEGMIDELKVYNRALSKNEVEELYVAPDKILTQDLRVFLGEQFDVDIGNTCATDFKWTPNDGVLDDTDPNSPIAPTESMTYKLSFSEPGCISFDTIRVVVIDPNELGCEKVFMPSAFTPNDDNTNDVYGMSNPEIFTFGGADLISFDIYDRWGNLVYQTDRPKETWNGFYRDQPVNPGVFLYKIRFTCEGEELVQAGSLTVIR